MRAIAVPVVTIDGKQVTVAEGATILDAARRAHVWIPTLCHNPAVSEQASCRICMVEVGRGDSWQLVTACNYPVRRDLTVRVSSEKAVRIRRGVAELLLARSPESKELRELASRMGVESSRYPSVTESVRSCILCGLCVVVCEEIIGASAIGFQGRGVDRIVGEPFAEATGTCIACGACAAVCPVGTIELRVDQAAGEAELVPFKARVTLSLCAECGKRTVSPAIAAATAAKVNMDWEQFKVLARLCPECRRKHAAASISQVAARSAATTTPGKES